MVTEKEQKRNNPEYSINRVRDLAATGRVRYQSTRVEADVENLEFAPEDVHRCLSRLEERHFQHAVKYENRKYWLDVYLITCQGQADYQDNLYIKLKLDRDCIWIWLDSFHRERWL